MLGAVENISPAVLAVCVTVNVGVCVDSLAGPTLMAVAKLETVCRAASSLIVTGFPASVKLGASLTGLTVMVKVFETLVSAPPLAVPPLSINTTLNVAVPFALAVV